MVLLSQPTFAGCVVEARPVGVLEMLDQGVADEKILAVAVSSTTHSSTRDHAELYTHVSREIEHFFAVYKTLEGKQIGVQGWREAGHAQQLIRQSHERFNDQAESA